MQRPTSSLLHEIEAFLAAKDMAETTFGRKAVNDGKLIRRLRNGKSVTIDTAERIKAFIRRASQTAGRPDQTTAA